MRFPALALVRQLRDLPVLRKHDQRDRDRRDEQYPDGSQPQLHQSICIPKKSTKASPAGTRNRRVMNLVNHLLVLRRDVEVPEKLGQFSSRLIGQPSAAFRAGDLGINTCMFAPVFVDRLGDQPS